ncbi:MAG: hypothetical protein AAF799_06605 [Myxococcota bacterium]
MTAGGWVAARNMFICTVLGCGVVGLHVRGRIGWATVVLVIGLLAGEAALAAVGIVVAWQLCLGERRLRPLVPYAIVVIGWRVAYRLAGFGSAATSCYDDPGSDLLGAIRAIAIHLPSLLGAKWLLVPVDMWASLPTSMHAVVAGGCAVAMLGLAWAFRRLLREDAHARFYGLAMVLALVPFTLTMPMDRLVLFGSIGASGLLALAAVSRLVARPVVLALLVLHLPVSLAFGLFRGAFIGPTMAMFTNVLDQAPADAEVPQQTFVNLNGTFHREHYLLLMRHTAAEPVPRRSVVLAPMVGDVRVIRKDERTLEVTPTDGFMAIGLDRIHRRDPRLALGHVVSLPDVDIEVVALTDDGRPATVTATFRVPLEDPSLRWLVTEACDPEAFPVEVCTREREPPAVGQTVDLPAVRPF